MKNKPDNDMISRYTYNVNNLGQRTAVTTAGEAFDTASPADWQWSYDVLGQVKSAIETSIMATRSCQYSYDQIGNRISSQKGNSPEVSYTSNSLNQYTAIGGSLTPSYDADGNQLNGLMPTVALPERGQLTFSYNAHRPTSVSKNNIILENYTHDHEGRRIQEGNTITLYDGYNAIAEYTVNGVLKITYAWGLDLSNTLQGAGGVGGLLSQTDYTGQLPLISYPTYDGNGNVTEYVTEANNGTLATHYEYDSFGNVIRNTMNRNYRYQFSTKPYNRLTGLNYYNYRDYDPVSGRWISPDPIEEQGGLNLYGFVGNNANDYIDYLGLKACSRRVRLTHFGDGKKDDVGTRDNKLKPGDIAVGHYGKNKHPKESDKWVLPFGTKVKIYPDNSPPFNGTVSDVGAYDKVALGKNKEKIYTPSDWIDVWNPDKSKKEISDEGCIEVEVKDACPCPKTYEDKPCPSSTKS